MTLSAARRYLRECGLSLAVVLFCIVPYFLLSVGSAIAAVTTSDSVAEKWVRAQIDAGKEADLSRHFPKPAESYRRRTGLV